VPLLYRDKGTSGTQLEAMIGSLAIGSVRKDVLSITAGSAVTWSWTLFVDGVPPGLQRHGSVRDCDAAKAGLELATVVGGSRPD
jgi:hypothetical protein